MAAWMTDNSSHSGALPLALKDCSLANYHLPIILADVASTITDSTNREKYG
jgi:hypothetical protein